MAKIIDFYIPSHFTKKGKWISPREPAKIIEFSLDTKESQHRSSNCAIQDGSDRSGIDSVLFEAFPNSADPCAGE